MPPMRKRLTLSWSVRILCAACAFGVSSAEAQTRRPDKPSVEVNFEALKELQAGARGTSFAAPIQRKGNIFTAPLAPIGSSLGAARVTASGRKIPDEQPIEAQENLVTQRRPVNTPFGVSSGPAPRVEPKVVQAAKLKPKPISKPVETAKAKLPASKTVAASHKPDDEKELMAALEKETPKPIEAVKAKVPVLPESADFNGSPKIPDLKPDLVLPKSPKQQAEQVPETLTEAPSAPDVLVVKKDAIDLPTIELPAVGDAPAQEKPLLPSLEKRIDTLFAKQPKKEGVISDKTTIIDPSIDAQQKTDEVAAQLADQQEAERRAQLEESERLKDEANAPAEVTLPKSKTPLKLEETQIAALPNVPAQENKHIAAISDDIDLPPPALPSLTPITGDGEAKSSLDIVAPEDGVISKDTQPSALQPLDAAEVLPKVTKGEEVEEVEEVEKSVVPPLPDFSQLKTPSNESSEKTKVAIASLPKPKFVKANIKKAPEKSVTEGSSVAQIGFSKDATELDESAKAELTELAEQITRDDRNVRIVAYAAGTAEQASIARRISLSRALQIRAHLIDQGVNQLKINVQAMGNKEQAERADVFLK